MTRAMIADFDDTLFDKKKYEPYLLGAIKTRLGIDQELFQSELEGKYHASNRPQGTGYDLFAHLQEHGIDPNIASEALYEALKGQSFLFADVPEFITRHKTPDSAQLIILTVGAERYQRFKLELCPELDNIPVTIIGYNKGQWLNERITEGELLLENQAYDSFVLIDDKSETFDPFATGSNAQLYHIIRGGQAAAITPRRHVRVVSSLAEVN